MGFIENLVSEDMDVNISLYDPTFTDISLGIFGKNSVTNYIWCCLVQLYNFQHSILNASLLQRIWCQGHHSLQPERLYLASLLSTCMHIYRLENFVLRDYYSYHGWVHPDIATRIWLRQPPCCTLLQSCKTRDKNVTWVLGSSHLIRRMSMIVFQGWEDECVIRFPSTRLSSKFRSCTAAVGLVQNRVMLHCGF